MCILHKTSDKFTEKQTEPCSKCLRDFGMLNTFYEKEFGKGVHCNKTNYQVFCLPAVADWMGIIVFSIILSWVK